MKNDIEVLGETVLTYEEAEEGLILQRMALLVKHHIKVYQPIVFTYNQKTGDLEVDAASEIDFWMQLQNPEFDDEVIYENSISYLGTKQDLDNKGYIEGVILDIGSPEAVAWFMYGIRRHEILEEKVGKLEYKLGEINIHSSLY